MKWLLLGINHISHHQLWYQVNYYSGFSTSFLLFLISRISSLRHNELERRKKRKKLYKHTWKIALTTHNVIHDLKIDVTN